MSPYDGVHVSSDIGRLRKVLVHEPGLEWDLIPCGPGVLDRYLTEDILVLSRAQEEHQCLTKILKLFLGGENVLEFEQLLAEVLQKSTNRKEIVGAVSALESLGVKTTARLHGLSGPALARALIRGAIISDKEAEKSESYRNLFPPIPNLLFTRDLGVAIPGGFIVCHAAKSARRRENLLMRYVLKHPLFACTTLIDVRDFDNKIFWDDLSGGAGAYIEGGDVVILDEKTLMVGTGERTTKFAFDCLCELLVETNSPIEMVIRAILPHARASMHLDTVFTVLSKHEFMTYTPLVDDCDYEVYRLQRTGVDQIAKKQKPIKFKAAMEAARLARMQRVSCGHTSRLSQSREQWTDGANLFAIAPGILLGYDRNPATEKALKEHSPSYQYLHAQKEFQQIKKIAADFTSGKTVPPIMIGIPGAELSRARGGARCMTLPLLRDTA